MQIRPLRLSGTYEILSEPNCDDRGYFVRLYDEAILGKRGLVTRWVQENQSLSKKKGTIRGLHFQKPPYAETKLVRVVAGAIFDVFVDLRKNSETYGQWDAIVLSAADLNMAYIPKGFAHGFCTLVEDTIVAYKVDEPYAPQSEGGISWADKTLNIRWPANEPSLSNRDKALSSFDELVSPF